MRELGAFYSRMGKPGQIIIVPVAGQDMPWWRRRLNLWIARHVSLSG